MARHGFAQGILSALTLLGHECMCENAGRQQSSQDFHTGLLRPTSKEAGEQDAQRYE